MNGNVPWGFRLMTDRLPVSPPWFSSVELNPDTQIARYTDASGEVMEMAKHGTNKTKGTASMSGGAAGGDGVDPKPPAQDDVTTDYEQD